MRRFPGRNFLRNLLSGRTLLIQLVRRDFAKRFVGSAAGWIWGLIHPLVQLMVWTFVFQVCLKQEPPPGEVTNNYTVFLFAGYLPWMLFQETVTRSATTLVENSNLITKTVFPSEILPVTVFLSSMINHLLSLALAIVVIAVWVGGVSPMALLLPIYMLLLGMFAIGVGWVVASLQVYLRDTAQVLMVLMTLWFWITPIFISEELVPPQFRFLIRLNPLAYVVRAYRERLLSYRPPEYTELVILTGYAVAAFVIGGLFFRHLKRGFADVL
ncbi:MAG TPA: ABC transporter permease [Bryobacteraceae bacterium]|nr:ABC transporter permease [Bryobacteraceae bacterium]